MSEEQTARQVASAWLNVYSLGIHEWADGAYPKLDTLTREFESFGRHAKAAAEAEVAKLKRDLMAAQHEVTDYATQAMKADQRADLAEDEIAALRAQPERAAEEPSQGLLMSMALRYDHGLGMPGYYDQEMFKTPYSPTHAQRLESTLSTMRQLWEEVTGNGFYRPEKEAEYAARRAKLRALPLSPAGEGE